MKQRIWAFTAALAVLAALATPVLADSVEDYTGELDPATGLPKGSYQNADGESSSYIVVDEVFSYDPDAGTYLYSIGSSRYFSNVPNGALVAEGQKVCIQIPGGITAMLYRDGVLVNEPDLTNITETGAYVLQLTGSGLNDSQQFTFTICSDLTNSMTDIRLPDGFSFSGILLDGTELDHAYSNYYELLEEGEYQITWGNDTIRQYYTVKFTLDRVAPTLSLPGVTDGKASGQVSLADLESDCYIVMEHDGEVTTLRGTGNTLSDAGDYVLTVYDPAGNYTRYSFTIQVYLNFSAVAAIIMVALVAVGVFYYSRWVRKHARVG